MLFASYINKQKSIAMPSIFKQMVLFAHENLLLFIEQFQNTRNYRSFVRTRTYLRN